MIHGHGGDIYSLARELGTSPGNILDFSSNVSPLPPPESLKESLVSHLDEICCLPEVDSSGLRESLAGRYGLPPNTHFMLIQVLEPWTAAYVTENLMKVGILIRDCANFADLEGEYVRISLRSRSENDSLINSLKELDVF
jgi:histidinol-phosphate/aromatic aminotransferase/cobyric acid decarboxylase-like protein